MQNNKGDLKPTLAIRKCCNKKRQLINEEIERFAIYVCIENGVCKFTYIHNYVQPLVCTTAC